MVWFASTMDLKKVSAALPNKIEAITWSAALPNKIEAITWLLANCPAGCVVNENCAQWERVPASAPLRLCVKKS